jgi:hypothetical protein
MTKYRLDRYEPGRDGVKGRTTVFEFVDGWTLNGLFQDMQKGRVKIVDVDQETAEKAAADKAAADRLKRQADRKREQQAAKL